MQSRRNAILTAMLLSIFSLLNWVSVIITCLVTLRKGAKEGAIVFAAVIIPILMIVFLNHQTLILDKVILPFLLPFILAIVLRYTASWMRVLEAASLCGIIGVIAFHFFVGDANQFWLNYINEFHIYDNLPQFFQTPFTKDEFNTVIANFLTYFEPVAIVLHSLIILLMSRSMQAKAFNPGGFKKEFRDIKLTWSAVIGLSLILTCAMSGITLATNVIFLALIPFFFSGLSLVHDFANQAHSTMLLLTIFYFLLIMFFLYVSILIVLLSIIDLTFNLRARYSRALSVEKR